jgi:hypothetical protein
MAEPVTESPTAPFAVRLALIALLPLIALALYVDGQHYDPDLVKLEPSQEGASLVDDLFPPSLAGLQRAGQVRHFDKDNLYEYINGHAEYFIGAGFRALAVGEYGDSGNGQPALVVSLYDMGAPLNAFGVLVDEAGDQESVDVGTMGFRSGQGLSFIHGPYYAQVSLFDDALPAAEAGANLVQSLAKEVEDPGFAFQFPELGKVTSTRFVKESYHGLEFLNEVLERSFERNGKEIRAFLVQGSAAEIDGLVSAFEAFFQEDEMPYRRIEQGGLVFFSIEDPYEGDWCFVPLQSSLLGVYAPLDAQLSAEIEKFAGKNR